jgi:hypothetical protein
MSTYHPQKQYTYLYQPFTTGINIKNKTKNNESKIKKKITKPRKETKKK